jgi:hypothetical protein
MTYDRLASLEQPSESFHIDDARMRFDSWQEGRAVDSGLVTVGRVKPNDLGDQLRNRIYYDEEDRLYGSDDAIWATSDVEPIHMALSRIAAVDEKRLGIQEADVIGTQRMLLTRIEAGPELGWSDVGEGRFMIKWTVLIGGTALIGAEGKHVKNGYERQKNFNGGVLIGPGEVVRIRNGDVIREPSARSSGLRMEITKFLKQESEYTTLS